MSLLFLSGCVTTGDSTPKVKSTTSTAGAAGKGVNKEYVKLLLTHGSRAHAAGDHDEAQSAYGRILQADPKNAHAALGLGESLLSTGDLPRSIKYFDAASKDETLRATALQGQGIVLLKLGQYSGSEKVLRQALKLDPKLWRAWNALGRTLDKSGRFEEAEKSYQAALKENPASAIVHNNSGVSYLLAGKYEKAEQAFRAAVLSDPELKRARSNLRLAMAWQGKYTEAMTGVDRLELPTTLNNVGYIAMKRGDYRHAEAYFVQAKQSSPAFYDKADRNLKFLQQVRKLQNVAAQSRK
ncbi:MAG: tetratricopeptide repeat protein [Methyloligellaceae bacterium]